jgi:hypothetical protein
VWHPQAQLAELLQVRPGSGAIGDRTPKRR